MTDSLIVLAGGASSRMKKSTSNEISDEMAQQANSRSKALILLNERPMLDYLLYNAKQAGYTNIYIVIGKGGDLFKEYYGSKDANNDFHGLTISFAVQHIPEDRLKPLGTADAVFQTLEQYPELQSKQFVVCNCDNLYSTKAFQLLKGTAGSNAFINYDRDILQYPQERIERFALTKVNQQNFLEDILEKPSKEEVENFKDHQGKLRVSMNIFKFDGSLFYPFVKSCPLHPIRREKEIPTALMMMFKEHPMSVLGIPLAEHVPDLTSKEDILIMNEYLTKQNINLDWRNTAL
jgi:glucose-1-phosphate adenylyltransferase